MLNLFVKKIIKISWLLSVPLLGCLQGNGVTPDSPTLTVATLNMYLGFNPEQFLDGSVNLTDESDLVRAVDTAFDQFRDTEADERIAAMAEAIVSLSPDLIGLQEAIYLAIGDVPDNDFVQDLIQAIQEAGGPLYSSLTFETFSINVPFQVLGLQVGVLFKDREAILFGDDLECTLLNGGHRYDAARDPITLLGASVVFSRGVLSAECLYKNKRTIHVYSTHLDQETNPVLQEAQADELLKFIQSSRANPSDPVFLLGDFNALEVGGATETYAKIRKTGFQDSSIDPGPTCCQAEDLSNTVSEATERIDFIFYQSGGVVPLEGGTFADDPFPKSDSLGTLWPSDHFGVYARFQVP